MPASRTKRPTRRRDPASQPLEELRVAIRAFARGSERASRERSPGDGPPATGALHEARRLARELEDLIDYQRAPQPRRVRCTARQIALAARLALPKPWRQRLFIVRVVPEPLLHTDGTLAARALSRLLQNAFEAGSDCVMLSVNAVGAHVQFNVFDRAPGHGLVLDRAPAPFEKTREGHAGIGLALAWREARALGGNLRLSRLQGGGTHAALRLRSGTAEVTAR